MKELAKKMMKEMSMIVMDESVLCVAIDNYCMRHDIDLSDDEVCEIIDLIMDGEV